MAVSGRMRKGEVLCGALNGNELGTTVMMLFERIPKGREWLCRGGGGAVAGEVLCRVPNSIKFGTTVISMSDGLSGK
jgi:hypothetical protein